MINWDKEKIWIFLMDFFSKTCHQKSERSFFIKGYQMPFCARCTGLFIGYTFGFFKKIFSVYLSIIFIFIMFLDGFLQLKNIIVSNNTRRIITGFFCGLSIINLIKSLYSYLINKNTSL